MMRPLLAIAAVLLALAGVAAGADTVPTFDDPVQDARYRELLREIRCPKCQNESIADSNAEIAADLRQQVAAQVRAGRTDEEIVEFLRARYGDFVLYRPQLKPSTYALWAAPFVFLLIGAVVFVNIVRKRRDQPLDEEPVA